MEKSTPESGIVKWFKSNEDLLGIGQIMLQANKWTGILFLIGLFMNHQPELGFAAALGAFAGNFTARMRAYSSQERQEGLHGFSAALVGAGLVTIFQPTWIIWGLVLIGGSAAAMLQHFFIRRNVPAYTFPFILVTWVLVFILRILVGIQLPESITDRYVISAVDPWVFGFKGFGQVIFKSGTAPGVLFFFGVLLSSPRAALYGLSASFLAGGLAYLAGQPLELVYQGVFSFNAVLSAIVFSGPRLNDAFFVLIATILTLFVNLLIVESHLLDGVGGVLTFAFVLGTWITLSLKKRIQTSKPAPPAVTG